MTTYTPAEAEFLDDIPDQALWITALVLDAWASYGPIGADTTQDMHTLLFNEINRRFPDASEHTAEFFTGGHYSHTDMIDLALNGYDELAGIAQGERPWEQ